MNEQRLAIMQPYVFPYIGYFHLIEACNLFVFYDDVNFIKGGWINRNRILHQDHSILFTIPLSKASPNKLINEISPIITRQWKDKFSKLLFQNYKKAPFFEETYDIVLSVFKKDYSDIAELSIESILAIYNFLSLPLNYTKSSASSPETRGMDRTDRLIKITKKLGCNAYINLSGGKRLYDKRYFKVNGVTLSFVKSKPVKYKQYPSQFVPDLSIIDVMMFNSKEQIVNLFSEFSLA